MRGNLKGRINVPCGGSAGTGSWQQAGQQGLTLPAAYRSASLLVSPKKSAVA